MALQQYAITNSDGSPGGVQLCEGASCFPALTAGQTRTPLGPGQTEDIARATTTIDPTTRQPIPGATVPPRPSLPEMFGSPFVAEPTPRALQGTRGTPMPFDPAQIPITPPSGPPAATAAPPLPFGAPPPDFGGGGAAPFYADGTQHPAQGGPPRQPGGPFNAGNSGGYDNRQQVYVPGGAAAGPFATRSAPTPDVPNRGGGDYGGSGGGGGGSMARGLYHQIKGGVEAKLGGMGGFGGGGETMTDRQYKRQGRRLDRAYDRYNDALANPDPQQARGWARRALGPNRGNYPLMLARPELVAEAMGQDTGDVGFDWMDELPMADLAMITGGTNRRGLTRKTQPVKVPKILRQQGVKPVKPDYKRELDYSKYAAQLRDLYRGLNGQRKVLDEDALLGNLARAKNRGALRQGIEMQAEYDPAGAVDRVQGYFDSIFDATRDDMQANIYSKMAENYINERLSLKGKPKNIDKLVRQVARRFQ